MSRVFDWIEGIIGLIFVAILDVQRHIVRIEWRQCRRGRAHVDLPRHDVGGESGAELAKELDLTSGASDRLI